MDAAAALYGSREKDKAGLAALGFGDEIAESMLAETDIEIWPENWQAVMVFEALSTQWNLGMGGPIGLRYESLPTVLRAYGVSAADRPAVFQQVRLLERSALEAMRGH